MEKNYYIPILLGTARKNSVSEKIAKIVCHETQRFGFESNVISPRDHIEYPVTVRAGIEGKKKIPWQQTMNTASGLIIVTPEYNHGYPGELKLMLDMLFEEYRNKPVFVIGVSDGPWGGARVVENLYPVLICLNMRVLKSSFYTPVADKLLTDKKGLEEYKDKIQSALEKLQEVLK